MSEEKICPLYKAVLLNDKNPVTETWSLRYKELSLCDGERCVWWWKCSGQDQVRVEMDYSFPTDAFLKGIDIVKDFLEKRKAIEKDEEVKS